MTRTYPTEYSTFSGDESIIYSIREKIGDRVQLKRYYIPVGSTTLTDKYIMDDSITFYEPISRFWPYHLTYSGTTYSGVSNPQVLNYHYLVFSTPVADLTDGLMDFWVESFYLSDFEIWTAYLNVDLQPLVKDTSCITEDMEILKAAIDLVPSLRSAHMTALYQGKTVRDDDVEYRRNDLGGSKADPWKDLIAKLQAELDKLIEECNTNLYQDGYLIL